MSAIGSLGRHLNRKLVGESDSLASYMRHNRWQRLLEVFPDLPSMAVLDLGGETRFWSEVSQPPAHVTMINPWLQEKSAHSWLTSRVGDACALPDDLGIFDLVFSNSVIEHVGGHWRRRRFAEEVRRSAPRYWVQTPYRYFPVEAHFYFPFFQQLPLAARVKIAASWPLVLERDPDKALRDCMSIELLTFREMRFYFPDASVEVERFAGMPKSITAVKA